MWRRNVAHWLAFIAVVVWGGLPFCWQSIDPHMALAFLGLLCGAIYGWCPLHTNKSKIGVASGFIIFLGAILRRSLPPSSRRKGVALAWQSSMGILALVVVGSVYEGYDYANRLGQPNADKIENEANRDAVSVLLKTDLTAIRQQARVEDITADVAGNEESVPPSGEPMWELHRAREMYIRGLGCLNDDDVACARLYFQLGAERFLSAQSALAMGDTFNPIRLKELRIYGGVRPNIDEARKWYERARELAPSEASQRLQELEGHGSGP
jgi:hypothetical protein